MIPGFEERDAPPARIFRWGAILMLTLVVFAGGVWLAADYTRPSLPAAPHASLRSQPSLQASPARDAAKYEAAMDEKLRGYGWTDRAQGLARIPVETAMDILAAQGWPKEGRP